MPQTMTAILYSAFWGKKISLLWQHKNIYIPQRFPNDKSLKLQFSGLVLTPDHLGAKDLFPQKDCFSSKKVSESHFSIYLVLHFTET